MKIMKAILSILIAVTLSTFPVISSVAAQKLIAEKIPQKINWDRSPYNLNLGNKAGQQFSFICSPNGEVQRISGTDLYHYESSICTAAAHRGLITVPNGGRVTFLMRPGSPFYNGTSRNEINSQQGGRGDASFVFVGSNGRPLISELTYELIGWSSSPYNLNIGSRLNQKFTFICRSNGEVQRIYGTKLYHYESSLCTSAVHAGIITAPDGGKVTIEIKAGSNFYNGTSRNGIQSQQASRGDASFIFIASPQSPQSQIPEIESNNPDPVATDSDIESIKTNQACIVNDPTGTPLNVRANPNGKIINSLENNQEVYISKIVNDKQNRRWAQIGGYNKGNYKAWGWVIRKFIDC